MTVVGTGIGIGIAALGSARGPGAQTVAQADAAW